jgi:4-methyl-5(b-hydroxyethyl)-thiazole monophosphate biosynthesis
MVLAAAGVLDGRRATSYPGFLKDACRTTVTDEAVVSDAGVITSRGPGTALDFALALVAELAGPAASGEVEAALQREARPRR